MSLLDVIDSFATGTYKVNRTTPANPGYDTHGHKLAGTVTTFSIVGVVEPLTGRDLMVLEEAQRGEQQQWLYTATRLSTRDADTAPDEVLIPNDAGTPETWVVRSVEKWTLDGDSHWRVRIARKAVP